MVERSIGRGAKSTAHDASEHARATSSLPKKSKSAKTSAARIKSAPKPGYTKKTIALVYDFDGTLSPKPMQEYSFLPKLGIKAEDFWAECTALAKAERADPLITYMHLMYKKAKEKGLRVDRKDLVAQGRDVELYAGVESWFGEIEAYVKLRAESYAVVFLSPDLVEIARVSGVTESHLDLRPGALPTGLASGNRVLWRVSAMRGPDELARSRALMVTLP